MLAAIGEIRNVSKSSIVGLVFCALVGLAGGIYGIDKTIAFFTYDPYTVEGYSSVPQSICPGEPVNAVRDKVIEDSSQDINKIEITRGWIKVGGSEDFTVREYESTITIQRNDPEIRERYVDTNIGLTPSEPGVWKLSTTVEVYGGQLLFPDSVESDLQAQNTLTVKDPSECQEDG